MLRVTWSELWGHRSRLVALLAAIVISVGFVSGSAVFLATSQRALVAALTAPTAGADVIVENGVFDRAGTAAAGLARLPGVAVAEPSYRAYLTYVGPKGAGELQLGARPADPRLQWMTLAAGAWPTTTREIAVSSGTADRAGLALGSTITVTAHAEGAPVTLVVSGITDESASLFAGLTDVGTTVPAFFTGNEELDHASRYLLLGDGSRTDQALADDVQTRLGSDSEVSTSAAYGARQATSASHDVDVFGIILLVFGAIALLVSAVIIANTLSVVVSQRRRQLGLLRAAGASAAQVRRGVLLESAALGLVGSVGGVLLGLLIGLVGAYATDGLGAGLAVPAGRVGIAMGLGIAVTVAAGLLPARRAAAVSPVEALRPPASDDPRGAVSRVRVVLVAGATLVGVGLVVLTLVGTATQVGLAVAGAAALTVAVVFATPFFLPALLRVLGRLGGLAGPTARLAGQNALRNPGRAAATCVALMLAVGLVVMLQVGVASTKKTVQARIDDANPVDVTVLSYDHALSPGVIAAVGAVPGVSASTPIRTTETQRRGQADSFVPLVGLAPDAARVVAAGWDRLDDRTLLVTTTSQYGVTAGERVTLTKGRRSVTLTAVASEIPDAGGPVVTENVLRRLDPAAVTTGVWLRVPDKDRAADVMAGVRRAAAAQSGTVVSGSLVESAQYDQVLDTLLLVATALLGVAVLIAVIGVGNTLGLSVLERTRESALLRALGLQRRQLRGMLVVEAVLLAVAGSVVGVVAGIGFGWLGIVALARQGDLHRALLVVPVGPTLAVVALAVAAGALASPLPARRAAMATPTAALAEA
jgi:putative ABC transport system permease protein